MLVGLAVEDQGDAFPHHRLNAAGEIENGQAPVPQRGRALQKNPSASGPLCASERAMRRTASASGALLKSTSPAMPHMSPGYLAVARSGGAPCDSCAFSSSATRYGRLPCDS